MKYLFNDESKKRLRQTLRRNSSKAEQVLWQYIKNKQFFGYKFRRQFGIGCYIVDFYCPKLKLAIEVDGATHSTFDEIRYDKHRQKYIESFGIKFLRFTNIDIYENIEGVLAAIFEFIKYHPQTPPSLGGEF